MRTCSACDATYPSAPTEPWRCDCGSPLELPGGRDLPSSPPDPQRRSTGVSVAADLFPIRPAVTLGEGAVPLLDCPPIDATLALEYVSPTGSFKDRGAAAILSRAVDLGVDRVIEDSSGNAGLAVATYAARAGLDAEIFVPAGASPAKRRSIARTGAEVVPVDGDRAAVTAACHDRADDNDVWYASHAWAPSFLAGTTAAAYDWCASRDWRPPDAVVTPVGHGTLLLGLYRGFDRLHGAGWIDRVPTLFAVQAAGSAPLVEALGGRSAGTNALASGVQIASPARHEQLLMAVRTTGGRAVAVGESATRDWLDRLRRRGFLIEPTSALGPAGMDRLREVGAIDPAADVIVPLTGSGRG